MNTQQTHDKFIADHADVIHAGSRIGLKGNQNLEAILHALQQSSDRPVVIINEIANDNDWLFEPLTETEFAEFINFKVETLRLWRREGRGPQFIRISSRAIRYTRNHGIEWMNSLVRYSTSDLGSE